MPKQWIFVLGTRPEIIKVWPILRQMQLGNQFGKVVFTGQHDFLAEQTFTAFGITPDIRLRASRNNEALAPFLERTTKELSLALAQLEVRGIIVQGDTTSALAGALVALRCGYPLAHIEAGLRTHNLSAPFPEEGNRQLISHIADFHFCPTENNKRHLLHEGISSGIQVVGNTVVDAVRLIQNELEAGKLPFSDLINDILTTKHQLIMVSGHRRENLAYRENLCRVLQKLTETVPNVHVIYLLHPNPEACEPVLRTLKDCERILVCEPLSYFDTIRCLKRAALVITDSGGLQEEAACFSKRTLITRIATERPELVECGLGILTPLDRPDVIYETARQLLGEDDISESTIACPFGDGYAAERIVTALNNC